jgi:hypothetical protein
LSDSNAGVGTYAWTVRTGGRLTRSETRSLLPALAQVHAVNAVGRLSMLLHVNSGRRATLDLAQLAPPASALTCAAEARARRQLTPVLLGHSFRSYTYGMAVGVLENVRVDAELLFAAAMLHDIGLTGPRQPVDFTLTSSRAACDVAEEVGLSSAATDIVQTAITMHCSPGVALDAGPVAYLLSAGAGLDVTGLKSWKLPRDLLDRVVLDRPRSGFKREFADLWRQEAAAVPAGRARFLRRYGAFGAAITLAPFPD